MVVNENECSNALYNANHREFHVSTLMGFWLYKHAGIFKNTREVHREARGVAECFSHFSSVLKNSQVLI